MPKTPSKNPFAALRKIPKPSKSEKIAKEEVEEPIWIPIQLTSLNTISSDKVSLIRIEQNERLTLHGKFQLACIRGSVEILGYTMTGTGPLRFYPIYSPSSHSLLSIKGLDFDDTVGTIENFAEPEMLEIQDLARQWSGTSGSIIAIKALEDHLEGVETFMPIFKQLFTSGSTKGLPNNIAVSLDQNFVDFSKKQETEIDKLLVDNAIVGVVGNVNSGKSTTTRYIVNRALQKFKKIAYLDCDVGQPELGVLGNVSLHIVDQPLFGPPFTHTMIPYHSSHLGFVSPKTNPDDYLKSLIDLINVYMRDLVALPLIVNTCGWVKGIGYDILCSFLEVLSPTDLVILDQQDPPRALSFNHLSLTKTHYFPSTQEEHLQRIKLNAADQRSLHYASYFLKHHNHWDFTHSLGEKQPFRVHCSQFRVLFKAEDIPFSQALYALNGSIVGLAIDHTQYNNELNQNLAFLPCNADVVHNCIGLGIIRSIDQETQTFYILTPIPAKELEKVNLIIRGALDLPAYFYSNGFGRAHVPYTTFMNAEGIGSVAVKNKHLGRKRMKI